MGISSILSAKNQTEGYITVTESGTYNLSVKATNVFSNNTELITSSIDIDLTHSME